ncbi:MAG: ABC transporter permease [Thermoleophilia bacterium]|nr:ABC transporter permease [Thermoleophilia bacterium]
MAAYIVRRLVWVIVVLLAVTMITFAIFYLLPTGDPAVRFAGKSPTPQVLEEVRRQFGLDKPWYAQYWHFLSDLTTGDKYGWPGLGFSFDTRIPVREELLERAPRTLSLAFGAAIVWLTLGVTIGIVSALRRGTLLDRAAMGFALFGVSAPVFWLGLMALWLFAETGGGPDWLHFLPGTGYVPFSESPSEWFTHLIMPWVVLALLYAAFYARMTRGNLLETMGEDYIRTARAKGLTERRVVFKHGLRASLTPIVTMFGMDIALLVGGAVITETVFNIQGLGAWAVRATFNQDLPAVVAVVVVSAFAVAIMNLLVDIVYAWLDPRVRYQ